MAGLLTIVGALARAVWRDIRKLNALAANNFFLFCFLALGQSGAFLQVILGLLVLFPLSADPLRKVPPERLALWPLTRGQGILLRLASLCLSPAVWITTGLLIWLASPLAGIGAFVAATLIYSLASSFSRFSGVLPEINLLRHIPRLPGRVGGLIQKNIREMLSILDAYAGLVLSIAGIVYRLAATHPEPEAFFGITLLISLSLSTYAQCLFALDAETGFERYHLVPLRGWQILGAKDAAFLLVLVILTAPFAPLAGLAAGFMALAIGHYPSALGPTPQPRWRFTGGSSILLGFFQVVLMFSAATVVYRSTVAFLAVCAAVWLGSLWYFGRQLERPD
ncbi:MAG TPA: hypothetical protein VKU01_12085 [Bryobacteraceae bacterium]|nr:hypothetical protein [Bryobacteraceae bacterium]